MANGSRRQSDGNRITCWTDQTYLHSRHVERDPGRPRRASIIVADREAGMPRVEDAWRFHTLVQANKASLLHLRTAPVACLQNGVDDRD